MVIRRFQVHSDVGINSPHQTNTQSVNVILQPSSTQPLTKDKLLNVVMNKANIEEREIKLDDEDKSLKDIKIDDKPLKDEIDKSIKTGFVEIAKEKFNELQ